MLNCEKVETIYHVLMVFIYFLMPFMLIIILKVSKYVSYEGDKCSVSEEFEMKKENIGKYKL